MRTLCSLGLVLLAACPGEAPPLPTPDAGEQPIEGQRVSGKAMDYFATAPTPLQDAALSTDGIAPPLSATSALDGAFAFERVPVGSQIFFSAARPNYRATRNMPVTVADAAVEQDIYLMSTAVIQQQYATDGKTPTAGRAFVVAQLQRNNGQPLVDVPLTDITLVDGLGAPVPGAIGPYVIGGAGIITPAAIATASFGTAGSRIAFLDVPPGNFSLKVLVAGGQGPQAITTSVTAAADGATLVRSGGMGGGGMGGGGGTPLNPRFATDIYPRLQTAANGGLACANCHTLNGTAALAPFNVLAADVLAALKAKAGLIDLATPANSLLLTKPLYEKPPALQNHPNATFVDADDGSYKLMLLWIQQGAL